MALNGMNDIRGKIENLDDYRTFVSDEAEKSIQNLFLLLNNDTNLNNSNKLSTNINTTKSTISKAENFSGFAYSESAKRLKSALHIDNNNGEKVESAIFRDDFQEETKAAVDNAVKPNVEQNIQINANYNDEIFKLYEFERERANIYVEENQLLKKQNHILLEKLGDVINENEGLQDCKAMFKNHIGDENENTNNAILELDQFKQMYESKVKSLETQLAFLRRERIKLNEENQDLYKRIASLEFEKGTTSEFFKSDGALETSDIKNELSEQIQSLHFKLGQSQASEHKLMDEIQHKNRELEDAQLEMTSAYIERDRLKEDLMISQKRWEEQLNNLGQDVANHCQAEYHLTTNKLLSVQEMNKELIAKVAKLQNALGKSDEEIRRITIESNEIQREYSNSNLKHNMMTDNLKLNEIHSRYDEDNSKQQIQALKVEINQCEQERRAERLQLKQEIDSLNKRLFESERLLLQCREEVVGMQEIKQKLENKIDALEQNKILLEKKLFDLIKNADDEIAQRELQFKNSIILIQEQHGAKLFELEKNLETYKNLSEHLEKEWKVLIDQFEETVHRHKFEMKKAKQENRTLKQHFISNLEDVQNIVS